MDAPSTSTRSSVYGTARARSNQTGAAVMPNSGRLLAEDFYRVLGTVGDGQPGLVLEFARHDIDDDRGLAVVVHIEELGRQAVAPGVSLALLRIDSDFHEN